MPTDPTLDEKIAIVDAAKAVERDATRVINNARHVGYRDRAQCRVDSMPMWADLEDSIVSLRTVLATLETSRPAPGTDDSDDAERLAAIDAQINRARLLEGTSDVVFLRRLLAENVAQRSATSPQVENPTPRLRALSIANQRASLFTSAGGRVQVTEAIEKHIIAALNAAIVRTRDAAPQSGDAESKAWVDSHRYWIKRYGHVWPYDEFRQFIELLDAAQSALADSQGHVTDLQDQCKRDMDRMTDLHEKIAASQSEVARLKIDNESYRATSEQAHHDRDVSWRHIAERDTKIRNLEVEIARLRSPAAPTENEKQKQIARVANLRMRDDDSAPPRNLVEEITAAFPVEDWTDILASALKITEPDAKNAITRIIASAHAAFTADEVSAARTQGVREGIERAARWIEKMGTGAGPYGACRRECAAILRVLAPEPQPGSAQDDASGEKKT